MTVISRYQAKPILQAIKDGKALLRGSLDLEKTKGEIPLSPEGAMMPDGSLLSLADLEEIADSENGCFFVEDGETHKIQFFSEEQQRFYSLFPTKGAPTMRVAGFPMHRIKDVDPSEDTKRKIACIAPVKGRVLDTTMGLGYTAILAARSAEQVTTIELDPTVVEVCRLNPWSQDLFARENIDMLSGDAFDLVGGFASGSFHFIVHDPPTFKLAGHLYSAEFYAHLLRLLRRGGKLFHYTGDLKSATGATVAKGAVRRLREVGFRKVEQHPEAFGVVALT